MIELTPAAAQEIKRIQISRHQIQSYFRLSVTPGGCSGWYYQFELCPSPQAGDRTLEISGIALAIDPQSLSRLENLRLDFAEDLMGGGFRFHNPHAIKPCSCGLSFDLKVPDLTSP